MLLVQIQSVSTSLTDTLSSALDSKVQRFESSPADKQLSNFYLASRLLQLDEAAENLIQKEIEAEKTGVEHDCILPDVPEEDLDSIFNSLLKI